MKKTLQLILPLMAIMIISHIAVAQTQLAPDQNPNYLISQQKYMGVSDSLNGYHSTTVQDTYKAIDYLEDKKENREIRRAYRRANRYSSWGFNNDYAPYGYNNGYNNYNYGGYYNGYSPWSGGQYLNNYLFNTVPLALTFRASRHWWR